MWWFTEPMSLDTSHAFTSVDAEDRVGRRVYGHP